MRQSPLEPSSPLLQTVVDFADPHGGQPLRVAFGAPEHVLVANTLEAVKPVLHAVQDWAHKGYWCVGYVRYEAGPAFDSALVVHQGEGGAQKPLVWFGVHAHPLEVAVAEAALAQVQAVDGPRVVWQAPVQREEFDACMADIHRAIANGELYQVNYTAPLQATLAQQVVGAGTQHAHDSTGQGSKAQMLAWFAALRRTQPHGYCAYIDTGDGQVLSVSPELFFDWREDQLLMRPMKGTAARGVTSEQDAAQAQALRDSPKERAENVMIVDLVRNDVSRVAEPFSVQVPHLFQLQALPTVWQMTSDVVARTRPGTSLVDVFGALFPCGSVTGAPKVQAMRMIRDLETSARGVYCGAVGVVRPGGHATFNVPIRTVTVEGGQAVCGIGSGITADAQADGEWREWQVKRAFVDRASVPFDLLETLAMQNGVLQHLSLHLERMAQAAQHFAYPWSAPQVQACLQAVCAQHPAGGFRVRLLLNAQGVARAEAFAAPPTTQPVRLQLATKALHEAGGEFVRFKTTRRAHYDAFASARADVFDTVLWNAQGEVTECTRGNLAFLLDGHWITPALHCGLLPGVGRAVALRAGRVRESVVRVEDLSRVQEVAFINSLRGWLEAELVDA